MAGITEENAATFTFEEEDEQGTRDVHIQTRASSYYIGQDDCLKYVLDKVNK